MHVPPKSSKMTKTKRQGLALSLVFYTPANRQQDGHEIGLIVVDLVLNLLNQG